MISFAAFEIFAVSRRSSSVFRSKSVLGLKTKIRLCARSYSAIIPCNCLSNSAPGVDAGGESTNTNSAPFLTNYVRKAGIIIDVQKKLATLLESLASQAPTEKRLNATAQLASTVGVQSACSALGVARACFYRQHPRFGPMERAAQVQADALAATQPARSPRALSITGRETVLACLHSERFQDRSPAEVFATLLDEGVYHCSMSTMHRLLEEEGESGERRDQLTHPAYRKPELLATGPNQLWSWDITKLLGPAKWTYFYLYVIMDVFSR